MLALGFQPAVQAEQVFYTTGDPAQFAAALERLVGVRAAVRPVCWVGEEIKIPCGG